MWYLDVLKELWAIQSLSEENWRVREVESKRGLERDKHSQIEREVWEAIRHV